MDFFNVTLARMESLLYFIIYLCYVEVTFTILDSS